MLQKILLFLLLNQINTMKKINQMCTELKAFDLMKNFGKNEMSEIFTEDKVLGQGTYGKVYSVLYYPEEETNVSYEIAVKELLMEDKRAEFDIQKEIAILSEFSKLSSSKFVKFIDCFYFALKKIDKHEKTKVKVFLMQEQLDDNLKENIRTFQNIEASYRYLHYLKLIDDLRYFHNQFPKPLKHKFIEDKPYVHLDIKLDNIMSKGKIDSNDFTLKMIDFRIMEEADTEERLMGSVGYMHPSLAQKKDWIKVKPQFDVYSLFVCIAQLEYGFDIIYIPSRKICWNNYTYTCHYQFLYQIYIAYCRKWNIKIKQKKYKVLLKNAYNKKKECTEIICLIFRELRMDVNDIDNAPAAFDRMKIVYEKLTKSKKKNRKKII